MTGGDVLIRRHFRTLLGVYTQRQRIAFAAKILLWSGAAVLLLLLSGTLGRKILLLCSEYGEAPVQGICFFLAVFLLFLAVMECSCTVRKQATENKR